MSLPSVVVSPRSASCASGFVDVAKHMPFPGRWAPRWSSKGLLLLLRRRHDVGALVELVARLQMGLHGRQWRRLVLPQGAARAGANVAIVALLPFSW